VADIGMTDILHVTSLICRH